MRSPLPWFATISILLTSAITATAQPRVVAYVPNWINLTNFSDQIDYARLTHINIAFENPVDDSGALSVHAGNHILIERARSNHVKILVSIGGGSASENSALRARYFHLIGESNRTEFISRLADYVDQHGFDGLDVDLEGPAINADYGPFIRDLAPRLRDRGKLLTAALSKDYGGSRVPDSILPEFDFVNIMAYDATGTWPGSRPGQHSSFEFATNSVGHWIGRGLPKSKAVLGVPFYGYGFHAAERRRSYSYSDIVAAYPEAPDLDEVGDTIWYNGRPTLRRKCRYVIDEGLGGVMIWSLQQDLRGEYSLLTTVHEGLR